MEGDIYISFMELTENDRNGLRNPGLLKIPEFFQKYFVENESVFYHVELSITRDLAQQLGYQRYLVANGRDLNFLAFRVTARDNIMIGERTYSDPRFTEQVVCTVPIEKIHEMVEYAVARSKDSVHKRTFLDVMWLPTPDESRDFICTRFVAMLLKKLGLIDEEIKTGACMADDIYRIVFPKKQVRGNFHISQNARIKKK